jgi:hypothetical protein
MWKKLPQSLRNKVKQDSYTFSTEVFSREYRKETRENIVNICRLYYMFSKSAVLSVEYK